METEENIELSAETITDYLNSLTINVGKMSTGFSNLSKQLDSVIEEIKGLRKEVESIKNLPITNVQVPIHHNNIEPETNPQPAPLNIQPPSSVHVPDEEELEIQHKNLKLNVQKQIQEHKRKKAMEQFPALQEPQWMGEVENSSELLKTLHLEKNG